MLCEICQKEFTPSKYRPSQKACSNPECQHIRQLQNEREWRIKNSDYFRCNGGEFSWRENRRLQSKRWRQNHKNYLREYREDHCQQRREYMREYMRRYRNNHFNTDTHGLHADRRGYSDNKSARIRV